MSLECITITGFTGVCDSIPTFTNLKKFKENNAIRIHPSTDNFILNINAAQIIRDKSNQIASDGVVHFVDEVRFFSYCENEYNFVQKELVR